MVYIVGLYYPLCAVVNSVIVFCTEQLIIKRCRLN